MSEDDHFAELIKLARLPDGRAAVNLLIVRRETLQAILEGRQPPPGAGINVDAILDGVDAWLSAAKKARGIERKLCCGCNRILAPGHFRPEVFVVVYPAFAERRSGSIPGGTVGFCFECAGLENREIIQKAANALGGGAATVFPARLQ